MHCNTASPKSQENAVLIAIHPTTYRRGGFLAHGVLNKKTPSNITHNNAIPNPKKLHVCTLYIPIKFPNISLNAKEVTITHSITK